MTHPLNSIATLTPLQFEKHVRGIIVDSGIMLSDFSTTMREVLEAGDGNYEIDIVARFTALQSSFLVLIECKHHTHPIKRDVVQVLYDRVRAVGAHKGILFTTSTFQRGAIQYAKAHGISLVKVTDQETEIIARYVSPEDILMDSVEKPLVLSSWLTTLSDDGNETSTRLGCDNPNAMFQDIINHDY